MWVKRFGDWIGQKSKLNDDEVAWFGFWLAEGCKHYKTCGSFDAPVFQKVIFKELDELMKRLGAKKYLQKDGMTRFSTGKRFKDLVENQGVSYQKYIPSKIKNLPKEQLEILIEWMGKGDGTKNDKMWRYNTTSKILADDFQEICIKCGYTANISIQKERISQLPNGKKVFGRKIYHINIRKRRSQLAQIKKDKIEKILYSGKIYCVETSSGVIMTRRNGKPLWTANSWDDFKYFISHLISKADLTTKKNLSPISPLYKMQEIQKNREEYTH